MFELELEVVALSTRAWRPLFWHQAAALGPTLGMWNPRLEELHAELVRAVRSSTLPVPHGYLPLMLEIDALRPEFDGEGALTDETELSNTTMYMVDLVSAVTSPVSKIELNGAEKGRISHASQSLEVLTSLAEYYQQFTFTDELELIRRRAAGDSSDLAQEHAGRWQRFASVLARKWAL